MTPDQFRAIRHRLGLSVTELAHALRIEDAGTIRRYERGDRKVSGPCSALMEALDLGILGTDGGWVSAPSQVYGNNEGYGRF